MVAKSEAFPGAGQVPEGPKPPESVRVEDIINGVDSTWPKWSASKGSEVNFRSTADVGAVLGPLQKAASGR